MGKHGEGTPGPLRPEDFGYLSAATGLTGPELARFLAGCPSIIYPVLPSLGPPRRRWHRKRCR